MANKRISELASASSLSGSEVLPVVQGGTTKKVTAQAIANLASGGGGGGGLPVVTIVADGSIGGPLNLSCQTTLFIPEDTNGTVQAEVAIVPNMTISGGGGYGGGTITATSISFPDLEVVHDFMIQGISSLVHLSANNLVRATSNVSFYNNSSQQSASFNNLESTNYMTLGNTPNLTNLTFPKLKTIAMGLSLNGPISSTINGYTSAIFPVLEDAFLGWGWNYLPSLTINLPFLKKLRGLNGTQSIPSFTINLPNVIDVVNYSLYLTYVGGLTSCIIGTPGVIKSWGGNNNPNVYINNCNLDEASIDNFLKVFASFDGTNGTRLVTDGQLYMQGGGNASPSAEGLAAKATLLSRGWYIQHN